MGETSHRRALAGLGMLAGKTAAKALTDAGYSRATASNPTANGLMPERCMQAAVDTYDLPDPRELVMLARSAMREKLKTVLGTQQALGNCKLGEIARAVQVCELSYSATTNDTPRDVRAFLDRLGWLQELGKQLGTAMPVACYLDAAPQEQQQPSGGAPISSGDKEVAP